MALIQTVHLSMANFKSAPVVPAVQNDTDRQVKMIVDDFDLTSGMTGKIAFQRSDGTHYETSATLNTSDNSFTADIDQALTQPGRTMVQLKVTDTLTVSTFSFVIFVEQDNSGTVTPQEGIDLVSAVQAAEDAADRAEAAASSLELDATLTSPTKAAQAKAVGDAIAGIHINVDDTLTQQGEAADAKAVGDAINGIESNISELSDEIIDFEDWAGYPRNLFDARDFAITNQSNWEITSATKTSITINHKTQWTTGQPGAEISLSSGEYVFNADFSESSLKSVALYKDTTFLKTLTNGTTFEIGDNPPYIIRFAPPDAGTYIVKDISIKEASPEGIIQEIQSNTDNLSGRIDVADADISDLQNGFSDITESKIESLEGTETEASAIGSNGAIYTAGSTNYRTAKFNVTPGKKYWVTANNNYGNLLWCFYNASDSVVELGQQTTSGSAETIINDTMVTAPTGSSYIVIAYIAPIAMGYLKTQTGYELKKKWVGKKWVCVGDSLTAENIRTTKHYFDYVAEASGIEVVNMGYSGSGYARLYNENHAFYQRISSCPTDADVVTIFGSFNDLGAGLPIGSVDDTGTTTLAGCINTTITNLQTVIPLVILGIVAPTPWDTTQPSTSGNDYNYVEMLKAICARRSIPFLDLWRESNLRPWDADFRALAYSKDGGSGTHPDETGHKIIAPKFEAFLDTLLLH